MATYVIGDVQGCFDSLQRLLDVINFQPKDDRLIFAGDMVNRGPKSLATLRFIRSLGDNAYCVLGNHDLYLLMCACGGREVRAKDTFVDVLSAPDADELLNYLASCPLMLSDSGFNVVHAGLLPSWSLAQAQSLSQEFGTALKTAWAGGRKSARDFFQAIWNDEPNFWHEGLLPPERWRVTVNGMTRLRMIDKQGRMVFSLKGGLDDMPDGTVAWFNAPHRQSKGAPLVCGHWSAIGLMLSDDVSHIDTGCAWGRKLTALRLPDRVLYQVSAAE